MKNVTNLIERAKSSIHVRANIAFNHYLTPIEKSKVIFTRQVEKRARQAILGKLNVTDPEQPYFAIKDYKIYCKPSFKIKDQGAFLDGMSYLVTESFVFPNFFYGNVQLHPGDTVLDLGANIGTTAILFSQLVGENGHIYAVDPISKTVLSKNLEVNRVKNVEVLPVAVSNEIGDIEIQLSDYFIDSSITKREKDKENKNYHEVLKVPLTTVDTLMKEKNIQKMDFIKMDIEGAEEQALEGAIQTIKAFKPKWSISSYHTDNKNEKQHPKLVKFLKSHGYQIHEHAASHIYAW